MAEATTPELTGSECDVWREEIERRCGISFSESRLYVLRTALLTGMRRRGIETYREYHRLVSANVSEWEDLLEALLNRETSFFRHLPSFAALSLELLPGLVAARRRKGVNTLALWSAGCSSGEEAYSMAMMAHETLTPGFHRFEVLGSDLSARALAVARAAYYGERAVADVPERLRARYFLKNGHGLAVSSEVKALVRFERFNLVDRTTYPASEQDVIFCQNVLIYFRDSLRVRVARNLASCLSPGGYLVAAPGELAGVRLPGMESYRSEQATVLRREDR